MEKKNDIPTVIVNPKPGYRICPICKKEFTQGTLLKHGGTCFRCSKKIGNCKVCDAKKGMAEMWDKDDGPFCTVCYLPRFLSYFAYVALIISLSLFMDLAWLITVLMGIIFVSMFWIDDPYKLLKNLHYNTIGPTKVRNSSISLIVMTIVMCVILIWAMTGPWIVYTVEYDHSFSGVDYRYTEYGGVTFTHEYHLKHVIITMDKSNEDRWLEGYFAATGVIDEGNYNRSTPDIGGYPWLYSYKYDSFKVQYKGNEAFFEARESVAFMTLILASTSFIAYSLSLILAVAVFRITSQLEPNYLNLKKKEKYQTELDNLAKKVVFMREKGVLLTTLTPILEMFKVSEESKEEIGGKNPLTALKIMLGTISIGILFSFVPYLYLLGNWFEAGINDGLSESVLRTQGWQASSYPYTFTGNHELHLRIKTLINLASVIAILTVSHMAFLYRSCYNMVNEIIDMTKRTNDFKIPSEFLITPPPITEVDYVTVDEDGIEPGEAVDALKPSQEIVDDDN